MGQIQIESEARRAKRGYARLYVFHNRPQSGAIYEPISHRFLPDYRRVRRTWRRVQMNATSALISAPAVFASASSGSMPRVVVSAN